MTSTARLPGRSRATPAATSPERLSRRIDVPDDLRIRVVPGVYAPQADSLMLADALRDEDLSGARVLDLCAGSGYVAITAARAGARDVVAVDVSRRAAICAQRNLRRNGEGGVVRRGDLLHAADRGQYDVIVSNPPYVPASRHEPPSRGRARAWDAGRDGRVVLDRICSEAPARLRRNGRLLLVQSHVADVERTLDMLRDRGLDAEVVRRLRVPFGPVMDERAQALRPDALTDVGHEELSVVRAVRPG